MAELNIGLIGYKFMGKAHSQAYRNVNFYFEPSLDYRLKVLCGRNEKNVKEASEKYGWEEYETDWRKVVERDDIDLVDIGTPTNTHKEIAIAAARAGKHVLCEKPLALSLADANEMLREVKKAGVKHMVGFTYRRVPAIALAKRLIDEGRIGAIHHVRANYLQDWIVDPEFPLVWRMDKAVAGSGSHGDLNAHMIDLARYLCGEFEEVMGMSKTFVKERPDGGDMDGGLGASTGDQAKLGKVTVDDATLFLANFENGAIGNFEATRFATGRKNKNCIEINGSKGSIAFNFERMNELQFFSKEDEEHIQGFRTILVTEPCHKYMSSWWPAGHIIGYEHCFTHQAFDLIEAIASDQKISPDLEDGVRCQEVIEAVEQSIEKRGWVKIESLREHVTS
ncbi:Gfo/Idh/MocA family protein [Jeotgalibacillus proteolyticus]|uniref:Dehydrogenase n=1 Tax=Jeotgalibacillus proteolyticus TaxID=2082395 RepID=A0A2S5G7K5_9BACL|nr:Gfo/Idh/MocA family oxidoreductase [Jeotgalibacillus proteolyticus]PPA68958.1 dehydrogenase [Jeotgalibacillus proteolyticus]